MALTGITYAAVTTRDLPNGSIKVKDGNGRSSVFSARLRDQSLGLVQQHHQALAAHYSESGSFDRCEWIPGYLSAGSYISGARSLATLVWVLS